MKVKKFSISVFLTLLIIGLGYNLYSGPTIIRDNRITDIALTPVLGRGYTIVTNTFQSKCLDNVVITEPSYDFQYKFESIENTIDTTVSTETETQVSATYMMFSADVAQKSTFVGNVKEFYHRILVSINMDTYYSSVDEAKSKLSGATVQMLQTNDIPGFFMSCGSYYVRSLGRNAKFVSLFTYQDKSESKDASFEASMKVAVSGFGAKDSCPGSELNDCLPSSSAGLGGSASQRVAVSFKQSVGSKKLTIETHAYGLGKNEGATLISYDLETFKAAIKDAFISMQNPMTGKVTTMEVVPWVENTEFQSLIKLETETAAATGKQIPLYEKKHILNLNGEYLSEIEKASRNMINIYYKAKLCQQEIETNYMQGGQGGAGAGGGSKQFLSGYGEKKVFNNKTAAADLTLAKLYEMVKDPTPLLEVERKFMNQGAKACIDEMLKSRMYTKSWRDIESCYKIRGDFAALLNKVVDDHCMPELAPSPVKAPKPPVADQTPAKQP